MQEKVEGIDVPEEIIAGMQKKKGKTGLEIVCDINLPNFLHQTYILYD